MSFLLLEGGGKLLLDDGSNGALLLETGEPPPPPPPPAPVVPREPGLQASTYALGGALITWDNVPTQQPATFIEDAAVLVRVPTVELLVEADAIRDARALFILPGDFTSEPDICAVRDVTAAFPVVVADLGQVRAMVINPREEAEIALIIGLIG